MNRLLGTVLAVSLSALPLPALAGEAKVGALQIKEAWARATPARAPAGGAYVTVTNTGSEGDTLVAAAADVSKIVELHTHIVDGDVMRMVAVDKVEVPAGQTVTMEPGGYHIMLIGLVAPIKEGTSFPLELTFAKAGKVSVTVDVLPVGAMGRVGANGVRR